MTMEVVIQQIMYMRYVSRRWVGRCK